MNCEITCALLFFSFAPSPSKNQTPILLEDLPESFQRSTITMRLSYVQMFALLAGLVYGQVDGIPPASVNPSITQGQSC